MEEILAEYGQDIIKQSNENSASAKMVLYIVISISLLVSILLATIIIITISRRTKAALSLIKKTADLDLVLDDHFDGYLK